MLNNKKSIYVLVPVNLLVWGFTAYKVISAFREEAPAAAVATSVREPLSLDDSVSYRLRLDYDDPFLKQESRQEPVYSAVKATRPPASAPPLPQKTATVAPVEKPAADIKYLGLVQNKTSGLSAAMIALNGSPQIVKPGQTLEGLIFQSFTEEQLVVKIGKERITIKK